jgi:AAA15 family ATPase/GTPase
MLIKSIQIERFRCFHKTKAQDFGRVNLLGGKNNAGKTAFLEALFLMNEPSNQTIHLLLQFRNEDMDLIKRMPKRAWDNFFYKGEKQQKIIFICMSEDTIERQVEISCSESDENFNGVETDISKYPLVTKHFNKEFIKSALQIDAFESKLQTIKVLKEDEGILKVPRLKKEVFSKNILTARTKSVTGIGSPKAFKNTLLILSGYNRTNEELAEAFDKTKLEGSNEHLLKAFQIIDETIAEVATINIGKSVLYLRRRGESNYIPLTLYGDAMIKVADFILRIVNNKGSLLLIDEIENGIHHSNQQALWKLLFELAIMYDVQLFATTHSAEMIEAFKNVVIEGNYQEEARYFELSRHAISKEIIAQKLSIGVLEDKLNHKKPLRGE